MLDVIAFRDFVIERLRLSMVGTPGELLRANGGVQIIESLMAHEFATLSNIAQGYLDRLKQIKADNKGQDAVEMIGARCLYWIDDAATSVSRWQDRRRGSWFPSVKQMTKLSYRVTVACRLMGAMSSLIRAKIAIRTALGISPGDPVLVEEEKRVDVWVKDLGLPV